jgi:acetoin utilization deacetylase AcuC-like enzyme
MSSELCKGRLVLALEGGYNAEALQNSVTTVLWELTGQSVIDGKAMRQVEDAQYPRIAETVSLVQKVQRPYWGELKGDATG